VPKPLFYVKFLVSFAEKIDEKYCQAVPGLQK
jgi:hypothetical protein